MEAGANVNVQTANSVPELRGQDYGDTPLIWASSEGHEKIVKFLIDDNANVNIQNDEGKTALTIATFKGYKKIVKQWFW